MRETSTDGFTFAEYLGCALLRELINFQNGTNEGSTFAMLAYRQSTDRVELYRYVSLRGGPDSSDEELEDLHRHAIEVRASMLDMAGEMAAKACALPGRLHGQRLRDELGMRLTARSYGDHAVVCCGSLDPDLDAEAALMMLDYLDERYDLVTGEDIDEGSTLFISLMEIAIRINTLVPKESLVIMTGDFSIAFPRPSRAMPRYAPRAAGAS